MQNCFNPSWRSLFRLCIALEFREGLSQNGESFSCFFRQMGTFCKKTWCLLTILYYLPSVWTVIDHCGLFDRFRFLKNTVLLLPPPPKELFLVEILEILYIDSFEVCFETYWRSRSMFTLWSQIIKWRYGNVSDIRKKIPFQLLSSKLHWVGGEKKLHWAGGEKDTDIKS